MNLLAQTAGQHQVKHPARARDGTILVGDIVAIARSDETSLVVAGMTKAVASSSAVAAGQLAYHIGSLAAAGNTTAGNYGLVLRQGVLRITDPGGISQGDLFYVSNTGTLATTPGTFLRAVGQALIGSGAGGFIDMWFDGGQLAPVFSHSTLANASYIPLFYQGPHTLHNSTLVQSANGAIHFTGGMQLSAGSVSVAEGGTTLLDAGTAVLYRVTRGALAAGAPRAIRLPSTPLTNTYFVVIDADATAAASNLHITTTDGSTIGNAASPLNVNVNNRAVTLCYDSIRLNWDILGLV